MARARARPLQIARCGDLVVERDPTRPSGRLLTQDGMEASYLDLADPSHLEFDYMRWMRFVLRAFAARRVLHIGGAGCALARALAAEDRVSRQEVCEVDAQVLEVAREHLGLRRMPGLRIRHAEGRRHLSRQLPGSWDAVVVDAFVGARVPRQLISVAACAVTSRVAPLMLVNVVDDRSRRDVGAVAAGLATAFAEVWAIEGRVADNTVLIGAAPATGSEDQVRRRERRRRIASDLAADRSPARLAGPGVVARWVEGSAPLDD